MEETLRGRLEVSAQGFSRPGSQRRGLGSMVRGQVSHGPIVPQRTKSACWIFVFGSQRIATKAAAWIRKCNREAKQSFLRQGSVVTVKAVRVSFEWHCEVTRLSLEAFFYRRGRRQYMGPKGQFGPWHSEVPLKTMAAVAAEGAAPSASESVYVQVPAAMASCAIDCSARTQEIAMALEKYGFALVRGFVPGPVLQRAREAVESHFLPILRGFREGLAVQELRDVNKVPPWAWTRYPEKQPQDYNPYAKTLKWGCATSTGYMQTLGGGQALSWQWLAEKPAIAALQHYPQSLLADLQGEHPDDMCWMREGVSVKGVGAPAAELHRDEHDEGRLQCVIMMTQGAFTACPYSHLMPHQSANVRHGHFHMSESFAERVRRECPALDLEAGPGDLYIFKGGTFVHGSPAVTETDPAPRLVTYSSFWPPGTVKGVEHATGKCRCQRRY